MNFIRNEVSSAERGGTCSECGDSGDQGSTNKDTAVIGRGSQAEEFTSHITVNICS